MAMPPYSMPMPQQMAPWAMPWNGQSPGQMIGAPAQNPNLALFGQMAQQPAMPQQPQMQYGVPPMGWGPGAGQGMYQQQPPDQLPGNPNYLAAILQSIQAMPQMQRIQLQDPRMWQMGQGAVTGQPGPMQQAPISSLAQAAPPPVDPSVSAAQAQQDKLVEAVEAVFGPGSYQPANSEGGGV